MCVPQSQRLTVVCWRDGESKRLCGYDIARLGRGLSTNHSWWLSSLLQRDVARTHSCIGVKVHRLICEQRKTNNQIRTYRTKYSCGLCSGHGWKISHPFNIYAYVQSTDYRPLRRHLSYDDVWEGKDYQNSELFCAVLCNTVVHNHMHTDMSSSCRWTVLGFGFWVCLCVFTRASFFCLRISFCISSLLLFGCQYQCNWLGLSGMTGLQNDLLGVEWDVKLYPLTHSLTQSLTHSSMSRPPPFPEMKYARCRTTNRPNTYKSIKMQIASE